MKVVVFTTLFPNHLQPNNGIFIKQRMFHFAQLDDCEIKVVAPVPYCPPWQFVGARYMFSQIKRMEVLSGISVYHPRYPLIPKVGMAMHWLYLFLGSIYTFKRIQRKFPFDVIDAHYIYPDGLAAVLLGRLVNRPVVLSARGSDINQFSGFRTIRPMLRYALSHSDHVISVCKALKKEMVELGTRPQKITVIPNGVDTRAFFPVDKSEARRQLSIPLEKKIILSVGGLIPRKGFHVILDTMPMILSRIRDIHLYIVGEGPYRSVLLAKIKKLELEDRVNLVGERPNSEMKLWYSAADVLCLASSREGWANVIMESLACGTPVVATNVWGAPEILTSPDVGILVARDHESITNGISNALTHEWDRNMISNHIARWTWHEVALEVKQALGSTRATSSHAPSYPLIFPKRSESRKGTLT